MRRSERLATKRQKANQDDSRISSLPDALLHHIFSFLQMDLVVRTSVLSKRWRYLWKSTPTINIYIDHHTKLKSSRLFINHVLFKRDTSSKLDTLNLKSEVSFGYNCVCKWMEAATIGTVDELSVNFNVNFNAVGHELPDQIFKSGIKKLSLRFPLLKLPKSMCSAGHIKSLRLEDVSFPNVHLGSRPDELILNCPVLENLIVKHCSFINYRRTLTISTPQLKSLEFYEWIYNDYINKNIICPKLTSFCLSGNIAGEISLKDISALTSVTLKDVCFDYPSELSIQAEDNFIKHLLKEAKVLTKMVVYFKPGQSISSAKMIDEYKQKVLALPAVSSNLSISFPSSCKL